MVTWEIKSLVVPRNEGHLQLSRHQDMSIYFIFSSRIDAV